MVFENKVLRRIFGPKGDEIVGCWGKLNNKDLHNFYSSRNITRMVKSRRVRWAGHIAHMPEKRKAFREARRRKPLGRPRRVGE
jgi:hypothetical protein